MTEQKDANNESTPSATKSENTARLEYLLSKLLLGLCGAKELDQKQLGSICEYLKKAMKLSETSGQIGCVTLRLLEKPHSRWKLRSLHKNTHTLAFVFFQAPTNNNTHTPATEAVTP